MNGDYFVVVFFRVQVYQHSFLRVVSCYNIIGSLDDEIHAAERTVIKVIGVKIRASYAGNMRYSIIACYQLGIKPGM